MCICYVRVDSVSFDKFLLKLVNLKWNIFYRISLQSHKYRLDIINKRKILRTLFHPVPHPQLYWILLLTTNIFHWISNKNFKTPVNPNTLLLSSLLFHYHRCKIRCFSLNEKFYKNITKLVPVIQNVNLPECITIEQDVFWIYQLNFKLFITLLQFQFYFIFFFAICLCTSINNIVIMNNNNQIYFIFKIKREKQKYSMNWLSF